MELGDGLPCFSAVRSDRSTYGRDGWYKRLVPRLAARGRVRRKHGRCQHALSNLLGIERYRGSE